MFNLNKEAKLAYTMLIPTISIVFLIILFPIFGNFWLSFKEVKLGDLRAPQPIIKEKPVSYTHLTLPTSQYV